MKHRIAQKPLPRLAPSLSSSEARKHALRVPNTLGWKPALPFPFALANASRPVGLSRYPAGYTERIIPYYKNNVTSTKKSIKTGDGRNKIKIRST